MWSVRNMSRMLDFLYALHFVCTLHTYYDYFFRVRFYCLVQSSRSSSSLLLVMMLVLLLLESSQAEEASMSLEWLWFGWGENGRLSLRHVNIKGWNASLFLFVCDFSEKNFTNFLLLFFSLANEFFGRGRRGCWIIMIFLILKHVTQFHLLIPYI